MSDAGAIRAARTTAAIFELADRGVVEVRGDDRVRFLHGQLTNDIEGLDPGGPRSGCHALVLTAQGRIVAELHVLARREAIWLETDRVAIPALTARLEKYLIADDVQLADRSDAWARFGVEGPRAAGVVAAAAGEPIAIPPDSCTAVSIAGADAIVAAFGWSGDSAFQLLVPSAARDRVASVLAEAAERLGAIFADAAALEILRVEAGVPRFGAELGEQTLPAEARLVERAVSFTKGCYTGQEIVARMHSRGRVGHLLVGLALAPSSSAPASLASDGKDLPAPGTALLREGAKAGEITSVALSPAAGPIALGFLRSAHAEPGSRCTLPDGSSATVVALPFVSGSSAASGPEAG